MKKIHIDLALYKLVGLDCFYKKKLIEVLGYDFLINCSFSDIKPFIVDVKIAREFLKIRNLDYLDCEIYKMMRKGTQLIFYSSKEYPASLREIANPPLLLFFRGNFDIIKKLNYYKTVSIVGTRYAESGYKNIAYEISKKFIQKNYLVVSGLAKGIDAICHTSAINNGGQTLAVLGSGTDICYPNENKKLYKKILQFGGVVSEYVDETKPYKNNFPMRNRIISALSPSLLVIQAPKYSGSLITANLALNQGKDVYALPGSIDSEKFYGSNKLIKDGAYVILDSIDIDKYFY